MSKSPDDLNGAQRELEIALATLQPADTRIHRDALLFQAGQRATQRRLRAWQTFASALAAMLALALLTHLPAQPANGPIIVTDQIPSAQPLETLVWNTHPDAAIFDLPDASYLDLRNRVITVGLEALQSPATPHPAGNSQFLPLREIRQRELNGALRHAPYLNNNGDPS